MDKEKQILSYMKSLKISREEAEQLWEDDQADYIGEEGEEMTKKAKEIKRYEKSNETKERKVDTEKLDLLNSIEKGLKEHHGVSATYENEVKLHFEYNGNKYSVTLTKHRK